MTRQRCLLCDTADTSAVSHPSPAARRKTVAVCRARGGKPPLTSDTKPWYSTYKIYTTQTCGFVSLEERDMPPTPTTQNHSFVSQAKLWGEDYYLLWHLSFILDLNTCLTPETQNWRDLNYSQ